MVLAASRLTPRVQANIGIIRAGVARGLPSTEIQNLIRATGQPGIRRTDLLAGIRHASGVVESASRIRSVSLDRFPDPMRIELAKGPMVSQFSYDVRFRAYDARQGKRVDRFMTVRSNRNLTPRMIQEEAEDALEAASDEAESGQLSEAEGFVVVGARRRG